MHRKADSLASGRFAKRTCLILCFAIEG